MESSISIAVFSFEVLVNYLECWGFSPYCCKDDVFKVCWFNEWSKLIYKGVAFLDFDFILEDVLTEEVVYLPLFLENGFDRELLTEPPTTVYS